MSKGIWTKHLYVDGKIYFYNAAQNRSLWTPPPDSIVHEAINLKTPTYAEFTGASSGHENNTASAFPRFEMHGEEHQQLQQQFYSQPNEMDDFNISNKHSEYQHYQQDDSSYYPPIPENTFNSQVAPNPPEYSYNNYHYEEKSDQLAVRNLYEDHQGQHNNYYPSDNQQQPHEQQQQQQKQHTQHIQQQPTQLVSVEELMNLATSAKQKQQNSKRFRAQTTEASDPNVQGSSYLQQKNEFEARAGNRDDESGKWLVR